MTIDEKNVFHDTYLCTSFNVDKYYNAYLEFFFQLIQDVAGNHSYLRSCSIPQLQKEGRTWVIVRSVLDIFRYPSWPSYVKVETWPMPPNKYNAPRGTYIDSEHGERLAQCFSNWCILDLEHNHRPVRPDFLFDRLPVVNKDADHPMENQIPKIPFFDDVEEMMVLSEYKPHLVSRDGDYNGHINNIAYLRWILDSLPEDFLDSHLACHVDISWLKETHLEDQITLRSGSSDKNAFSSDDALIHSQILRSEEDRQVPVCEATIRWKRREALGI
ncbi:MAG: thioesterase [Sphaerochaetaceae bacterium]|jgi:medium-chain acyl-[acyl-carrier-protein] hydrolase|nr:thioesterase [Sphaerochaetaceae bacterium]NLY07221.1 hypothetical protein [Spirochaetales bacterium]